MVADIVQVRVHTCKQLFKFGLTLRIIKRLYLPDPPNKGIYRNSDMFRVYKVIVIENFPNSINNSP